MNGPPPFKSLMKAAEIEDAQKAEIEQIQDDRDAEASAALANAAIGDVFGTRPAVERDAFYQADRFWQICIILGLGSNILLGYASDAYLPSFVVNFRNYLTPELIRTELNWVGLVHLVEGSVALAICLKRNWYSPMNTLKWTGSTILFGVASMKKLMHHGRLVERANKKNN